MSEPKTPPRPLFEIAAEIRADGFDHYAAQPYITAMLTLSSVNQNYGYDSGKSIVSYFLANAGTWRGETARRVKAELKGLIK